MEDANNVNGNSTITGAYLDAEPDEYLLVSMEVFEKATSGAHTVCIPAHQARVLSLEALRMIISDEAYKAASRRRADELEPVVVKRFEEVYGARGRAILDALVERMKANIESDNRR